MKVEYGLRDNTKFITINKVINCGVENELYVIFYVDSDENKRVLRIPIDLIYNIVEVYENVKT